MGESVLTVIFQRGSDLVAQEAHVSRGAFFLPVPDPPPEPLAEMVLRVEAPAGGSVEIPVRVVQLSRTHVALALVDAASARPALAPLFAAARAAPAGEGAIWIHWGRPPDPPEEEKAEKDEGADLRPTQAEDALLYDKIKAMGSQEKMQLALHGDRSARLLLLKDVNKTIQTFLLQNPRITIDEIRYIAGYRQANPEVLVAIAAHRDWGANQNVVAALVRNPKTPVPTAVKLLDKLPVTELRRLAKSNEVPRAVQAASRKRVTE
jgi:hypothetical protein